MSLKVSFSISYKMTGTIPFLGANIYIIARLLMGRIAFSLASFRSGTTFCTKQTSSLVTFPGTTFSMIVPTAVLVLSKTI